MQARIVPWKEPALSVFPLGSEQRWLLSHESSILVEALLQSPAGSFDRKL
jgi:hypothetical protein